MDDEDYFEEDVFDDEPEYEPEPIPQPKQHQGLQTVNDLLCEVRNIARGTIHEIKEEARTQRGLLADYPGIENPNSPLHRLTAHYLNTHFGGNTRFAEDAAFQAAKQLGITPRSMQSKVQSNPRI